MALPFLEIEGPMPLPNYSFEEETAKASYRWKSNILSMKLVRASNVS
jgi:hypothetical protein